MSKEHETYPANWYRTVLMVNKDTGEVHCIGGDTAPKNRSEERRVGKECRL